jgi:hypothetical protein
MVHGVAFGSACALGFIVSRQCHVHNTDAGRHRTRYPANTSCVGEDYLLALHPVVQVSAVPQYPLYALFRGEVLGPSTHDSDLAKTHHHLESTMDIPLPGRTTAGPRYRECSSMALT